MGDRGNIKIGDIYLYTHFGGSEILSDLHTALSHRWRWNNEPYLTRIIFEEMRGKTPDPETGLGISTIVCDNEHDILEVDCENQWVINETSGRAISFGGFISNTVEANKQFLEWDKTDEPDEI